MKKKQSSKSKLWMFVFAGVFCVSVTLAIWMAMLMPKERTYEASSGNIISVVSLESSEWMYATSDGTLVHMTDKDNMGETYNVLSMIQEQYNIDAGILRKFYKRTDSDYLWLLTTKLDEAQNSSSYLFQARYIDGEVKLNAYTPFEGDPDSVSFVEEEGYLYMATSGGQVAELFKFDAADVGAGVVQNTYLYDCSKDGNKIKLTAVRMPNGIYSFESDGEYLYVLYNAGRIRVATDFGGVTYQSNKSSYKVDSLDTSKYLSFGLRGVTASGGAFVEETGTYYMTARNSYLYSLNISDINSLEVGDDLEGRTVEDINFSVIPAENAAIRYDEQYGVGYVLHDSSDKLTKLNLSPCSFFQL